MIQESPEPINTAFSVLLRSVDTAIREHCDGQNEIERYDTRASALLKSAKAVLFSTESYVSKLNEERNALVPFHKLPSELLVEVFQRALPAQWEIDFVGPHKDIPTFYATLGDFMSVCKRWRNTIEARPKFWSYVSVYAHPRFNARALSSNAPLIVDCFMISSYHNAYKKRRQLSVSDVKTFAEAVEPHVDRWLDARIVLRESVSIELFRTALRRPAPMLKELEISGSLQDSNIVAVDMFDGNFPKLTELRIANSLVCLVPSSLTSIKTLSLSSIPQETLPLQHLLLLLRSCSELQSLALWLLNLENDIEGEVEEFHNLRQLHSLSLNWLSCSVTQLLLSCIPPLPFAAHLSLALISGGDAVQDILHAARPLLPALSRIFEETGAAKQYTTISVSQLDSVSIISRTSTRSGEDKFGCEISLPDILPSTIPVFAFIRDAVSLCSVTIPLLLDLKGGFRWTETDYLRPLANLNVEKLCVSKGEGIDQRTLLEFLGTPLADDDKVFWPFPNLRFLDFSIPHLDVALLSGMLRRRYGADAPTLWGQRPLHPPARPEKMDIRGYKMTRADIKQMQAALAGDASLEIHRHRPSPAGNGEDSNDDGAINGNSDDGSEPGDDDEESGSEEQSDDTEEGE